MTALSEDLRPPLVRFLLACADDKLLLGHRNGDWTGLGPFLEEDIAFSNIAQDEIAHAQELYKLAASFSAPRGDVVVEANRLAFARPAAQRYNATLVELPDQYDWAVAVARQFFYDHFDAVRLPRLQQSVFRPLADLAGKMNQEVAFHVRHFDGWIEKLGRGTKESGDKLQHGVEQLWNEVAALFEPTEDQHRLLEADLVPGDHQVMRQDFFATVSELLSRVGVQVPPVPAAVPPGGRHGHHTPALDELLGDLNEVYCFEPEASW